MAQSDVYNTIIVSVNPRGRQFDGIIVGTPKPGVVLQIKTGTEPVGGKHSWVPYARDADGDRPRGPIAILCEDHLQGKGITDAYVTGTIGQLYCPLPGDELLMQLQDVSGTGDAHTIGEILMIDSSTGQLLITTGSPETESFVCLETIAAPTADVWAHVMCSGH